MGITKDVVSRFNDAGKENNRAAVGTVKYW